MCVTPCVYGGQMTTDNNKIFYFLFLSCGFVGSNTSCWWPVPLSAEPYQLPMKAFLKKYTHGDLGWVTCP